MARNRSELRVPGGPPSEWPGWVLRFGRGVHDEPVVMAAIREDWKAWRAARAAWVSEFRPDLEMGRFLVLAQDEMHRRQR